MLRLNQKLTIAVFLLALVPFMVLAVVLVNNMQNVVINDRLGEVHRGLVQIQTQAEKAVEMCNMTTQFFLNSPTLREFLVRAFLHDDFSAQELIDFYRNDVAFYERLVNANPYLYQVRVYHENTDIPEFMPILYHRSRMERLAWAGQYRTSGSWHFDYEDTIFPPEIRQSTQGIMALITDIDDYRYGRVGTLEVAIRMSELFPAFYPEHDGYYSAFATGASWFSSREEEPFWANHGQTVVSFINEHESPGESIIDVRLDGRAAVISSIPISQYDGRYIIVMFRDDITAEFAGRRNVFILFTALSILLLAFIVNLLVKAMLRRFYKVVSAVQMVRDGDMSVMMPETGDDEISFLGSQINQMLDRIRKLMDENVKRELLAKDSEIRALQSQINAHFIYNVLESIKMMAEVDSQYEISDAITSLGKLLRYSMRRTSDHVAITDELGHLENYIRLINLRYDYRIVVSQSLSAKTLRQRLPRLTIQPIVENSVVHGIEDIAMDTIIEISSEEHDDFFALKITDHGSGIAPESLDILRLKLKGDLGEESETIGIGLKNVHDRIVMAFGPEYGIDLASELGKWTAVTIRVPYTE